MAYSDTLDDTKTLDHYINQWQQESDQLDQGQEISSCEICWKNENAGLESYRQQMKGHSYAGKPGEPPRLDQFANGIEIFISNLCNQMCSYCSPKYSSEWENSIANDGMFANISTTTKNNLLLEKTSVKNQEHWLREIERYISTQPDNSVELKLLGGEPLMQMANLIRLLEFNSSKIELLSIHTNLNPPTSRFLEWVLETLPTEKLKINISIDSTPEYNHVPRSGFDQTRFRNNLALLEKHKVNFRFTSVISVLSIFDIADFHAFVIQHGYPTVFSKINNPDCLDPIYLPKEFKQHILNTQAELPNLAREILSFETETIDLKLFEQYNYLKQYFDRTKIDPTATPNALFNEYWTWLSNKGF
jgi:sulfatase maturation enzyme AslB (radical SAM superfamily)